MILNKILILIISVICVKCNVKDPPCSVQDSINITDGIKYSNGDIKYEDILYTPNFYGIYKNEYINSTYTRYVEPHFRGCICLLKSCIKFCCPRGQAFKIGGICVNDLFFNISKKSLSEESKYYQNYGVVYGKPCSSGYFLQPEKPGFEDDEWHLLNSGQLYLNFSEPNFNSKERFCLTKYYPNDTSSLEKLNKYPNIMVFMCEESQIEDTVVFKNIFKAIGT